jgi:hypothetical protein
MQALWIFISGMIACAAAGGDSPPIAPSDQKILSPNRKYYAFLDVRHKTTVVFEAGKHPVKRWEMAGWFAVPFLANDGDHLVVGNPGGNLLEPHAGPRETIIVLYERGHEVAAITLGQLVTKVDKLPRTESHVLWGNYLGFDEQNRFLVQTSEERTFALDPDGRLHEITAR